MRFFTIATVLMVCGTLGLPSVQAAPGCSSCEAKSGKASGCKSCGKGVFKKGIPIPIPFIGLGLFHPAPGGHPQDWVNCECSGQYNYPVPPQYTYHWPGMFKQTAMTDYHSPWRFPPIKPYYDEPSPGEAAYGLGIASDRAEAAEEMSPDDPSIGDHGDADLGTDAPAIVQPEADDTEDAEQGGEVDLEGRNKEAGGNHSTAVPSRSRSAKRPPARFPNR